MAYKVTFVKANFQPVGEYKMVQVPTGEKDWRGREKLITEKRWVQTGYSDRWVDGKRLAEDLQQIADSLNSDGYEILGMFPVISGQYKDATYPNNIDGGGYGYSYTEGVIVISRKAQNIGES